MSDSRYAYYERHAAFESHDGLSYNLGINVLFCFAVYWRKMSKQVFCLMYARVEFERVLSLGMRQNEMV